MLRNLCLCAVYAIKLPLLNEVLSLNAQESLPDVDYGNAASILNEVLSLNAQEFHGEPPGADGGLSSMKS